MDSWNDQLREFIKNRTIIPGGPEPLPVVQDGQLGVIQPIMNDDEIRKFVAEINAIAESDLPIVVDLP